MPAVSKAQGNLMRAAEHGANFPMPRKVRASMTHEQLHDFAKTPTKHKPDHVKHEKHLKAHAIMRGHGGQHAEAYARGAMNERHGAHKNGHPRTGASSHGYSGKQADAYMAGAKNEADGLHGEAESVAEDRDETAQDEAAETA